MFPDLTMMRLAPVDLAKPIGQSRVVLAALVHLLGDRLGLRIVPHPRPGNSPYKIINIGRYLHNFCMHQVCTVYTMNLPEPWEEAGGKWACKKTPQNEKLPQDHARNVHSTVRETFHLNFPADFNGTGPQVKVYIRDLTRDSPAMPWRREGSPRPVGSFSLSLSVTAGRRINTVAIGGSKCRRDFGGRSETTHLCRTKTTAS